jgi:hypothetical protein
MQRFRLGFVVTVALLLPNIGNAQVFQFRTPPPDVSAASASWQINGEPIMVGGITYYATRGFRLFDGQVMAQTGLFEGIPVYVDTTIAPDSELYVPLSGGRMRVYERHRDREQGGTTGSHTPTFPVDSPSVPAPRERIVAADEQVGTAGSDLPRSSDAALPVLSTRARPQRTVATGVANRAGGGVWLEFRGGRWYSDGPAVSFSTDRFVPVGEYHGFPVYRDKTGDSGEIWVSVVHDGPLAPYRKR